MLGNSMLIKQPTVLKNIYLKLKQTIVHVLILKIILPFCRFLHDNCKIYFLLLFDYGAQAFPVVHKSWSKYLKYLTFLFYFIKLIKLSILCMRVVKKNF